MYPPNPQGRGQETCPSCDQCGNNYDRWFNLFWAVIKTLRNAFAENGIRGADQVLSATLESVGVARRVRLGLSRGAIFALHPSAQILLDLRKCFMEPPHITLRRGRQSIGSVQLIDTHLFKEVHEYVKTEKRDNGRGSWIGVAALICDHWPTLLDRIERYPVRLRGGTPPIEAVQRWMDGYDSATSPRKRLQTRTLAYRLFTFLRFDPVYTPKGESIGEYVWRNANAMQQRLTRAAKLSLL